MTRKDVIPFFFINFSVRLLNKNSTANVAKQAVSGGGYFGERTFFFYCFYHSMITGFIIL